MPSSGIPELSVVVPARNAAATLARCLDAVRRASRGRAEIIVVDDGSDDGTAGLAQAAGAVVVRHDAASGPAHARNAGVRRATAAIVLFVDADIVLADDAVTRILDAFTADPALAAVFGSYDDAPPSRSLVSDYRNLLHHFVHQSSREESGSFWAGCGAVRKAVFLAVGGFDERYRRPSIEDIELGGRLVAAGHRIRLDKRLTGRHLKTWTLAGMVAVDVRDRAYPWARLMLRRGRIPDDLNLQHEHRVSAALVWLGLLSTALLAVAIVGGPPWLRGMLAGVAGSAAVALVGLNCGFYRFLVDRRGVRFAVGAFLLHAFYYAYASATFAWCWLCHHTVERTGLGEPLV